MLTDAGERAFCVGSDVGEVDAYATPWDFRNRRDHCDALRASRKPVIAAVNGYAYGGGLELAPSCDIRLASRRASFAAAEIKLGWIGGGGVTALLSQTVSASDAAVLLLTGDPVARSMGREAAIQYEREMQAICMATQDAAEGRRAFAEKRTPISVGR
jgi:enoyl-CoA hydratase/carnithine racemase